MNKKRYLILIALVIFVFLAVFTFANPLNKTKDENRVLEEIEEDAIEQLEEKEEKEETEKIQTVVVPQYNNHGVTIKKEEKDISYEIALAAVEKIEITLSSKNLESAFELVEKVTDKTKKEELTDRLVLVVEMIDLTDTVDTLVKNVNDAECKEDLDAARKYIETTDMIKRVDELSNELIKKLLIEKLETISKKVEDTKAPIINIEDGAIFNEEIEIVVTDSSDVTIMLNDEEIENNEIVSAGTYTLTAIDASFNEITIEFKVDTKAPEFIIDEKSVGSGEYYSELYMTLVDENLKYLEINGVKENVLSPFKFASEYYKKGENVIVATDAAGNETKFTFTYVDGVEVLKETFTFETTDEMITIEESETYVIDLNNNTFEIDERLEKRIFENEGTLIIKNGKMINKSTGYQYGIVNNYGTLIVENVEFIDNANGDGSTIRNRGGEIIIKNSSFENTGTTNIGNAAIISEGKLTVESVDIKSASNQIYPLQVRGGEATINNVTVDGNHGALAVTAGTVVIDDLKYTAKKYYGIYITNNGGSTGTEETNVTINAGIFNGELYGIHASVDDGLQDKANVNITINGGTFEGNNGAIHLASNRVTINNWNVTINGGAFNGNIVKGSKFSTEKWNLAINGGKFTNSVTSDLTTEYEDNLNVETGYYEVTRKDA